MLMMNRATTTTSIALAAGRQQQKRHLDDVLVEETQDMDERARGETSEEKSGVP